MADRRVQGLVVVIVEPGANTSVLVHLLGLVDDKVGLLCDLLRDGLVLTDNSLPDLVVERVEEVEEAG